MKPLRPQKAARILGIVEDRMESKPAGQITVDEASYLILVSIKDLLQELVKQQEEAPQTTEKEQIPEIVQEPVKKTSSWRFWNK